MKLAILKEYAKAYSVILAKQPRLQHIYIDAFAGAGLHLSKSSGAMVPGSPLNALEVRPEFREYHLIDLDAAKVANLRSIVGERADVYLYDGDCNEILSRQVFPRVRYRDYKRALCLLDPYGIGLEW